MMKFHQRAFNRHFNEVMDWLIQSHELGYDSLYKDIDSIESSFDSKQMSCLTFQNKTVGFATWRLQDRVAFVELFEIHPEYRNKGLGKEFFSKLTSFFISRGIYVVQLRFISDESEAFWTKMGFLKFKGNDFPSVTEKHLYKVIIECQKPILETPSESYLEIWDNNCMSSNKPSLTAYNLVFKNNAPGELALPIVTPCHYDWAMRFTVNGNASTVLKTKYFDFIKYYPNFMIIESL